MESKYFTSLKSLADSRYREFQSKLVPNIPAEAILGVRMPDLRRLSQKIRKEDDEYKEFLRDLPHKYYDENQLHALLVNEIKDFDEALWYVEEFLPHVDNWATCDSLAVEAFKINPEYLLPHIKKWINSNRIYTIRFGVCCLMRYFLDKDFNPEYLRWVGDIKSDEYYVSMGRGWYFATALVKQWDETICFLNGANLPKDVLRITIQKGIDSFRLTSEHKGVLRGMRQ
ncbi:DNA alkylation repair protein [Eubacteriales bacterium KG127]